MASTAYLRVPGIQSRSTGKDLAHRGWIKLDSVMFSRMPRSNRGGAPGGYMPRGEALLEDLALVKTIDEDTPALESCCRKDPGLDDIVIETCMTPKGTITPRTVRCSVKQATVLRHRIDGPPKGKVKGKSSGGKETILLRCRGVVFRQR